MANQPSLEDKLKDFKNPVEMLRHAQAGRYFHAGVKVEFSNWIQEQRAWRETAVLFDQSHHMTDLYLRGPDVVKILSATGINSFSNWGNNKAKQFVGCNYDGYVIGDAILFGLSDDEVNLVGRPSVINWVQFHAETGAYDIEVERDERTIAGQPANRKAYRYQVQGPNAVKVLEAVNGGPLPDIKFFNMGEITIAGHKVRALHHGMSGTLGLEIFGPAEHGAEIKAAILEAGEDWGLRHVGSRTYPSNTLESGWISCPVPAVYSGEKMKPYREWLPADWYEGAVASIGGSYYSDNIEDYYTNPWDLGYGGFVRFDHDFIGREALEKIAESPKRKKVTLAWNTEDSVNIFAGLFQDGDTAKFPEFPVCHYSGMPNDRIMRDGKMVGVATFSGYSYNERTILSLSYVDIEHSEPGTEVTLVWGEEDGGSRKPVVERHKQVEIRAIVSPAPYSRVVREGYAKDVKGWRA